MTILDAKNDKSDAPVRYCPPGRHRWAPRLAADHPKQCWDCPAVERQAPQPRLLPEPRPWGETTTERRRR
jgi:hypothetical protein